MQQPPNPFPHYPPNQYQHYPPQALNQYNIYPQQQNQRIVDKGMKTTAIIMFSIGFSLHVIGALTFFILIGIFFTLIGFLCDVIGFICLCLI